MKNIRLLTLVLFTIIFYLSSCYDIIEADLSKSTVTILTPKDSVKIGTSTVTLWWNEVDEATGYNVELVTPSFDIISNVIIDSNIVGDKFVISLAPGKYAWRIRAHNNNTKGYYTYATFYIDSNLNIANERIILSSPANNSITNVRPVTFKWQRLAIANSYRFQLYDSTQTLIYSEADITNTQLLFNQDLPDNKYTWKVRGENDNGVTQYSSYSLVIDSTPPIAPSLSAPVNNYISTGGIINFSWTTGTDNIQSDYNKLLIATDSFFSNPVIEIDISNTSYLDTLAIGKYYWSVSTIDKAKNQGTWSAVRVFRVQ